MLAIIRFPKPTPGFLTLAFLTAALVCVGKLAAIFYGMH